MLNPIVVLVFGGNGWIGSKVVKLLQKSNTTVIKSTSRADDINAIQKEITDIEKIDFEILKSENVKLIEELDFYKKVAVSKTVQNCLKILIFKG